MTTAPFPSSTTTALACDECGKSFARQEHLKRHTLTHTQERRFKCNHCGKTFLRRDALNRHEQLHQSATGPSLLQRGARACGNCASAKARCSGDVVCSRCAQRGVACLYPDGGGVGQMSPPPASRAAVKQVVVEYSPPVQLESLTTNNAILQPNDAFDTQYWNAGALSNINWLSTDLGSSESFDVLPWSFEDSQYWGDLTSIPFGISPIQQQPPLLELQPAQIYADSSTVSTESPATSVAAPNDEPGQYYVDGNDSRLPRVKRRKLSSKSGPKMATPIGKNFSLGGWASSTSSIQADQEYRIADQVYQSLQYAFEVTCLRGGHAWRMSSLVGGQSGTPFYEESSPSGTSFATDIPPKEAFDNLLTLYVEHFQTIVPIFRPDQLPSSWQLILAMCALGSHFSTGDSDRFIVSIQEFLRRVLHTGVDDPSWLPSSELEIAQTKLLHAIGLLYCGDERLLNYGLKLRLDLATCFELQWKNRLRNVTPRGDVWETWQQEESVRRTGYAIWLLDSMMAFQFQQKPLLQLDQAEAYLPCHERVWAATDANEWTELSQKHPTPPTLIEALQQLYIEKKLATDVSEFARILLVYGIIRRTWEVEAYHQQPLSRWSPTAQKQSSDELNTKTPIWLPSVPAYAKWRNSACDCFDILHWSANAAIGAASGMEHPTVMHLHLARIVLLTPHKNIISLATYLAGESSSHSSDKAAIDRQVIRRWATQDQYKARLAMIHAGVIFWHVRRFSANGFYESSSVALASLALWAFGAFSTRPKSGAPSNVNGQQNSRRGVDEQSQEDQHTDSSEEEEAYDIILLDRPTDDELVQHFVRRGNTMKANMNGVGDLYGERGPEKVLVEGKKLLATLNCWGIREKWMRVLERLVEISKQQRKNTIGAN